MSLPFVGDYPTSHHKGKAQKCENSNGVKDLALFFFYFLYLNEINGLRNILKVKGELPQCRDALRRPGK